MNFLKNIRGYSVSVLNCIFVVSLLLGLTACASSALQSDTETGGDTGLESGSSDPLAIPPTIAKLTPKIELVGSALIPTISSDEASQAISDVAYSRFKNVTDSSLLYLDYASADVWAERLASDTIILELFAEPTDGEANGIRGSLADLDRVVTQLFEGDPDTDCTGGLVLNEGDTIDVAFYPDVDNGTADNRYYDCLKEETIPLGEVSWSVFNDFLYVTTLYGYDDDNVFRIVYMWEYLIDHTTTVRLTVK